MLLILAVVVGALIYTNNLNGYLGVWGSATGTQSDINGFVQNPSISTYTDPLENQLNEALGINFGFILLWLIGITIIAILGPPLIGALIASVLTFLTFTYFGWEPVSIFTMLSAIPGAFLSWKWSKGSNKIGKIRKWAMILLGLLLLGIAGIYILQYLGYVIPGVNF
jgi:hypothetical protein